ncbi:hypothetical protein MNEG_5773 [Monoraphidium neglectum]|uniref:Uncharacterized protein n=1 Tax=Monoraphidium neglectum TaxID=145388 RepID=A0A0D2JTH4_9CHLO|nr:hypothetical protein MNEG_5773 [Monoraphidium neglectum]KIZ02188.1 hypothetical protein MNEG_5773 [Monoraphidium neglectum]|eukprot:XP_013901207.1 hypothetical protein MNEG_5773 [Monoraphidium neglectum]
MDDAGQGTGDDTLRHERRRSAELWRIQQLLAQVTALKAQNRALACQLADTKQKLEESEISETIARQRAMDYYTQGVELSVLRGELADASRRRGWADYEAQKLQDEVGELRAALAASRAAHQARAAMEAQRDRLLEHVRVLEGLLAEAGARAPRRPGGVVAAGMAAAQGREGGGGGGGTALLHSLALPALPAPAARSRDGSGLGEATAPALPRPARGGSAAAAGPPERHADWDASSDGHCSSDDDAAACEEQTALQGEVAALQLQLEAAQARLLDARAARALERRELLLRLQGGDRARARLQDVSARASKALADKDRAVAENAELAELRARRAQQHAREELARALTRGAEAERQAARRQRALEARAEAQGEELREMARRHAEEVAALRAQLAAAAGAGGGSEHEGILLMISSDGGHSVPAD